MTVYVAEISGRGIAAFDAADDTPTQLQVRLPTARSCAT